MSGTEENGNAMETNGPSASNKVGQANKTSADYYFDSYSHFGIHEEMLKDSVRTNTYQKAIVSNSFLFNDKIVLDVGCGTGILALFAAQAGARHVYGIECSDIAEQAKEIVACSKFKDKVTIIQGKVEEVELGVDKVDIIISEWMGYFLLYESMLDTVLYARDKWLVPGGALYPDVASMYVVGIEDGDYKRDKINYWDNVYGFDMSCIKRLALCEPLVDVVDAEQICTNECTVRSIDINEVKLNEVNFERPFSLTAFRDDHIHALVTYFSVQFNASHKPIGFTTSPYRRQTHWKQTVMYLDETINICKGETIEGSISVSRNSSNPRDLDIKLRYKFEGKYQKTEKMQEYRMR